MRGGVLVLCVALVGCFPSIDREAWKIREAGVEGGAEDGPPALPDGDPGGCRLRAVTAPTDKDLYAVWGGAPDDIWAAGEEGTLLHYDGTAWSDVAKLTGQHLYAVDGVDQDVWVVGDSGTVLHWSGGTWTSSTHGESDLNGVWAGAASVWAVGDDGVVYNHNGTGWSQAVSPTTNDLFGIWGPADTDLWAVGYQVRLRYDGTAWSSPSDAPSNLLQHVHGLSGGETWAVGHCTGGKPKGCGSSVIRYTGTSWSAQLSTSGKRLKHLWMRTATDGWVVGEACCGNQDCVCASVYRFDGTDWTGISLPKGTEPLNGVWGFAECDVWAVGDNGTILHRSDVPAGP